MKIGVLALQGDFKEHLEMLKKCEIDAVEVRLKEDLAKVDGLIIPGGESTTIGNLMSKSGIDNEIIKKYNQGMPIYGTCAGAILLAKEIEGSIQPRLGLLDIKITRNSYGRQQDSFEACIDLRNIGKVDGVFIRAPAIKNISKNVDVLGRYENNPVLVQQNNVLASTFHTELTDDIKLHKYFVQMVRKTL